MHTTTYLNDFGGKSHYFVGNVDFKLIKEISYIRCELHLTSNRASSGCAYYYSVIHTPLSSSKPLPY